MVHLKGIEGIRIHDTTNMVAKARAIRKSLMYCIEHNIPNIFIETDSLAMVHILEEKWGVPLSVALEVRIITRFRRDISASIEHSFGKEILLLNFFC